MPAINLACHSHCFYHTGDDSNKQFCLFSDPIICLYIIVLLIMLSIFEIYIVLTKLNNFALFFIISDLVHDEIIRDFYRLTKCGILIEICDAMKLQFAV